MKLDMRLVVEFFAWAFFTCFIFLGTGLMFKGDSPLNFNTCLIIGFAIVWARNENRKLELNREK